MTSFAGAVWRYWSPIGRVCHSRSKGTSQALPRLDPDKQRAGGAVLLAAVAVIVWVLAVPHVDGVASGILAVAVLGSLVTAGWLSGWSALGVALAPVVGALSERLDLNS